MRVIAVRRGRGASGTGGTNEWVVSPGPTTDLHGDDVIIAKGTRAGAERVAEMAGASDVLDDAFYSSRDSR
jgi:uncharacterized protein with PhoU and TrkA domain